MRQHRPGVGMNPGHGSPGRGIGTKPTVLREGRGMGEIPRRAEPAERDGGRPANCRCAWYESGAKAAVAPRHRMMRL